MHDGMPYGRNQGQGQGHSREVDRQSPTGLIFIIWNGVNCDKFWNNLFEIFNFTGYISHLTCRKVVYDSAATSNSTKFHYYINVMCLLWNFFHRVVI